jgi:DNA invertase Pin-like site-specific DNA recombinase
MRVSRQEQTTDRQEDHLKQAGCERIFKDIISGAADKRTGLDEALSFCREGDTFIVWELDRLGRSLKHLIEVVESLKARGVNFQVLKDGINTDSISGELVFHIFGALAEFERKLIVQRTRDGLAAARARGRMGGRPKKLDAAKIRQAQVMATDPNISVNEICQTLGISRNTYYRHVK